jgi:adenosine deaminase
VGQGWRRTTSSSVSHAILTPEVLSSLKQNPQSNLSCSDFYVSSVTHNNSEMADACETPLDYRQLCTCRRRYQPLRHKDERRPTFGKSPPGSLEDMLTCFEFFLPLVYNNLDLLENLAHDFVERQYEQNAIYTEVRYSPHLLAKDAHQAFDAVTRGLRRGCEEFGVAVNQILCAINFCPDWSNDIVEMAQTFRNEYPCAVVGMDIAAGEDHFTPDSPLRQGHYDMCQKAKDLGLNITIHAGETPESEENVLKAIQEYGATRIGHGYRTACHPKILEVIKASGVHMEVCPTSSVETGGWKKTKWTEHPACVFREYGISMSLNSDDPAVFNTSLTWQYRIALKKMGWDKSEILKTIENSVNAAFLPPEEKEKLRTKIRDKSSWKRIPEFSDRVHYE